MLVVVTNNSEVNFHCNYGSYAVLIMLGIARDSKFCYDKVLANMTNVCELNFDYD